MRCAAPSGAPELAEDPRFADASAIRRHRTEIIAILDEIIAERPLSVWAERFEAEGVWWAPAQTPAEVIEDPQFLANDGIVEIGGGSSGTTQRSVNGPVRFSDVAGHIAPVPALGEHTDQVIRELAGGAGAPRPANPGAPLSPAGPAR